MRHNEHRKALAREALHHVEHFADHLGVERARRFVEEDDIRVHRERPRDCHALLLAAGELRRAGVAVSGHADAL